MSACVEFLQDVRLLLCSDQLQIQSEKQLDSRPPIAISGKNALSVLEGSEVDFIVSLVTAELLQVHQLFECASRAHKTLCPQGHLRLSFQLIKTLCHSPAGAASHRLFSATILLRAATDRVAAATAPHISALLASHQ